MTNIFEGCNITFYPGDLNKQGARSVQYYINQSYVLVIFSKRRHRYGKYVEHESLAQGGLTQNCPRPCGSAVGREHLHPANGATQRNDTLKKILEGDWLATGNMKRVVVLLRHCVALYYSSTLRWKELSIPKAPLDLQSPQKRSSSSQCAEQAGDCMRSCDPWRPSSPSAPAPVPLHHPRWSPPLPTLGALTACLI